MVGRRQKRRGGKRRAEAEIFGMAEVVNKKES